ncbi:bifunctional diguanylate cyclase/phosphodiesterase [Paenibacillus sp. BR2-3]|uniref:EAL domain-containing protein n=1 Tax=Paenibacillus sp. BR2-3 TaxID=3048494 RepID=UPI00397794E6
MKIIKNDRSFPMVRFIFDTGIFMMVTATLYWHYIVSPLLSSESGSELGDLVLLVYPILDLGLLFAVISLYFISRYTVHQKGLSILIVGFSCEIIADLVYIYLSSQGSYVSGYVDPLWGITLLLKGVSGLHAADELNLPEEYESDRRIRLKRKCDSWIPYASAFILIILVSQHFDKLIDLQTGLYFTMSLIIVRQILTLRENEKIVGKLRKLSSNLESQVQQRTTELEENNKKLQHMAYHDSLTELPNRRMFYEHLKQEMSKAQKENHKVAIMLIDLDRFKYVNDTLGHEIGDLLLKNVSQRLNACTVEITENLFLGDENQTISKLQQLKGLGIGISIDDFGSGYSSFRYIKEFPVDELKIDRFFIRDILNDRDNAAIVRTMISLGHKLNIKVVAEGVETKEQLKLLEELHCDVIQGWTVKSSCRKIVT